MNTNMNIKMSLLILSGCCAALLGVSVSSAASESQEIAAIKKALESSYPEAHVTDIRPSPVPGLYQVFSEDGVIYVDRTGEYLLGGPMIATRTKTNLSQQALDERDSIEFDQLPLDQAIKTVRGNGERTIAVFADPDCPFCHDLEKELSGLSDITIYTFLYPVTALHPDARNKAHAIWCAPDRSEAWHDWMILDKAPPAPTIACTQDPIEALHTLGKTLKIASTPAVFLENGHRLSGTRPAAQLNDLIAAAHKEKLRAASNGGAPPQS
jgi:thiol:disulfide interchange protein DsbC